MIFYAEADLLKEEQLCKLNKKTPRILRHSVSRVRFWLSGDLRTPIVMSVEERIHNATLLPLETGEGMYVLRYEETQKYDPHTDYCRVQSIDHQVHC